jgi:uncharacterized caspase-like protein
MPRITLAVGINDYNSGSNLSGCVNDAEDVAKLLSRHDDGTFNFDCKVLTSSPKKAVETCSLRKSIEDLFSNKDVDTCLFYFAGHGDRNNGIGYICPSDVDKNNFGIPVSKILRMANESPARHKYVILDCCHAGTIRDMVAVSGPAPLKEGVALLAACRDDQYSVESGGRGLFTSLVCDALSGGAADVRGTVTAAGIYAYVDEVLSAWQQRPLFVASVSTFAPLRRAKASITDEKLSRLPALFPQETSELKLDPSFEPTSDVPDDTNTQTFSILQPMRAARLIEPVGTDHLYYAAMQGHSCRMTPLGRVYWRKAKDKRL